MKRFTFTLIITLFVINMIYAQCPQYLDFTTQEQIDNFLIEYPNCTEIEGWVNIHGENITNLDGLSNVISIGNELYISQNPNLTDITGLGSLTYVGFALYIDGNEALTSLSGLDNLVTVEGFEFAISQNNALLDLTGLGSLTSVVYFSIDRNSVLESLTGLNNLESIEESLHIGRNHALTNLTGLENITYIGGYLGIYMNNGLVDLTGLENLDSIGGGLDIKENDGLISIEGLNNLQSIGGGLQLKENFFLENLSGLESLTSIGSFLIINKCNDLASLIELQNLKSIGGRLDIYENNDLSSLVGLDSIAAESISDLNITFNPILSTCEVNSICEYLFDPNGDIEIHSNSPGCNNSVEVEYACTVSIDEINPKENICIHPNPITNSTTLSYNLSQPSTVKLTIFNHCGQQVDFIQQNQSQCKQQIIWDASDQAPGMYYFRFEVGEQVSTGKLLLER